MTIRTVRTYRKSQEGFALPAVIFILALLGVLAVTSLMTTGDARRASHGMRESAVGFYAAEAGANLVLADWDSLEYDTLFAGPGDTVDFGWQTLPENGASYHAVIQRVDNGGEEMYALRVSGRGARAQRIINYVLKKEPGGGSIPVTAALRGGSGGGDGRLEDIAVSGIDRVPSQSGWAGECTDPLVDVAGLEWQNGSVDYDGGALLGSPPYVVDGTINNTNLWEFNGTTYAEMAANADITLGSYNGSPSPVVSGSDCNTSVSSNWGAPEAGSSHPCWDYFPIIHLTGDGDMVGGSGQGILLIDGDLDMDGGGFNFYGIVMVRGMLGELDDGPYLTGAVFTHTLDRIRDGSGVWYSSCVVQRALGLSSLGSGGGVSLLGSRSWSEVLR